MLAGRLGVLGTKRHSMETKGCHWVVKEYVAYGRPAEAMRSDDEWARAEYEGVSFAGCDKKLKVNYLRAAGDALAK